MTPGVGGMALASIRSVRHKSILVIGDVMLDQRVHGTATRLSPEAPVPVVEVSDETEGLGGAANVANQLAAWGARVLLVGLTGDDAAAERLRALCATAGLTTDGLVVDAARPTTRKMRIVDRERQIVRLDWESTAEPSPELSDDLLHRCGPIGDVAAIVVSDYGKGVVGNDLCRAVLGEARARGIPSLVDPRAGSWERYRRAGTIKANRREYEAACLAHGCEPPHGGPTMRRTLDLHRLVVTEGADGIRYWNDAGEERWTSAARSDVADVTGAGDTVIASLTASTLGGIATAPATQVAALLAGSAVRGAGVIVITERAVRQIVDDAVTDASTALEVAERVVRSRRERGERIVLANGCFDLLHPGHLHLLNRASTMGDFLVVAVNCDASVSRLKGPHRPIEKLEARARALAGVPGVDLIVPFADDTPLEVIDVLRPDVIVKGSDHDAGEVVGGEAARSWGGSVRIVPRLAGFSTTLLVGGSG